MRKRLCNARTRSGGRCHRPAMAYHWRCRLHGAMGGRPPGIPAHPNTLVALKVGRERWLHRMRLAKASGRIDKIPGGRKPRGSPRRSADRTTARAQRMVEEIEMAVSRNRSLLPVSTSDATAEAYFHAGGMAIDVAKAMLAPQIDFEQLVDRQWLADPEHRKIAAVLLKAAALQSNLALGIISGQIRIGEARLRA